MVTYALRDSARCDQSRRTRRSRILCNIYCDAHPLVRWPAGHSLYRIPMQRHRDRRAVGRNGYCQPSLFYARVDEVPVRGRADRGCGISVRFAQGDEYPGTSHSPRICLLCRALASGVGSDSRETICGFLLLPWDAARLVSRSNPDRCNRIWSSGVQSRALRNPISLGSADRSWNCGNNNFVCDCRQSARICFQPPNL